MSGVTATPQAAGTAGYWTINTSAPGRSPRNVTTVRNAPTRINSYSFEDPFGPKQANVLFPGITMYDTLGSGELDWLFREANLDLVWTGTLPSSYPYDSFRWEGYMESFDFGPDGLTVALKGALYQADNYLAKPEYTSQPLAYENAILRQFKEHPDIRVSAPKLAFPPWWSTTFQPNPKTPHYLLPIGLHRGDKWTGLVTRQTGSWDPMLTSYVQTLLSSMYTDRGRWTLDLLPRRKPLLFHRDFATDIKAGTLLVEGPTPGIEVRISQDFSQSINAVYGQGKSLTGTSYTGQLVSGDGSQTVYQPLAQLRQVVHTHKNGWYKASTMRREVLLQVQQGLELNQAQAVGNSHLQRFGDPGFTGEVVFSSDPQIINTLTVNDDFLYEIETKEFMSRYLIRPGMTIQLSGIFGKLEGILVHISSVAVDAATGSVTCTVDSKYRDALTVAEVRVRGRDSLSVQRSLIGGQYTPPVSDELVPWNYAGGSGYIPHSPHYSCLPLFKDMPKDIFFPWTEWTKLRPPKNKQWRNSYIRIGPKSPNANLNWAAHPDKHAAYRGFPIKLSQAGSIRLLELAAYDKDGNVLPVPFHVSFYYSNGVNYEAMPMLRSIDKPKDGYAVGQHYPFFGKAWEQYNAGGTKILSEQPTSVSSAGLIRAYGTGQVKAGYWPGTSQHGDPPTGLLSDEAIFSYDCSANEASINLTMKNQTNPFAGYIYCMIYCDAQLTQEVFFMGRMFRDEPGLSGS